MLFVSEICKLLSWRTQPQDGRSPLGCCVFLLYHSWRLGCQLWSGGAAPGLAVWGSLMEEAAC